MKKTLLYRIWRNDKRMFVGIIVFICFQSIFIIKGVETSPFYLYGMYSEPYTTSPSKKSFRISSKNGEQLYLSPFIFYQLRGYQSQYHRNVSLEKTITDRTKSYPAVAAYLKTHLMHASISEIELNRWISSRYFLDTCIIESFQMNHE